MKLELHEDGRISIVHEDGVAVRRHLDPKEAGFLIRMEIEEARKRESGALEDRIAWTDLLRQFRSL